MVEVRIVHHLRVLTFIRNVDSVMVKLWLNSDVFFWVLEINLLFSPVCCLKLMCFVTLCCHVLMMKATFFDRGNRAETAILNQMTPGDSESALSQAQRCVPQKAMERETSRVASFFQISYSWNCFVKYDPFPKFSTPGELKCWDHRFRVKRETRKQSWYPPGLPLFDVHVLLVNSIFSVQSRCFFFGYQ